MYIYRRLRHLGLTMPCAGSHTNSFDGNLALRNRGDQSRASLASGRTDSGSGWLCRRRSYRRQRRVGRHRTHDEWDRRRFIRPLLGRQDRQTVRIERQWMGAAGPYRRPPQGQRRDVHAAVGH